MAKNIIKETVIVLLILLVIALLLGILFYDYIPMNKTVPIKVEAYKISNELEEELGKQVLEANDTIVKTYTVDSADLELYQQENDYDIGKKNPFSTVGTETEITDNNNMNANGENSTNIVQDNQPNINTTK